MTPEMVLQQIVLGDRRHDDAPPEVCGAVDPRDERRWCRIPAGHPPGFHNCYWQPGDAIT
jgi:hypothetical protein